jgi:hypothetical protein
MAKHVRTESRWLRAVPILWSGSLAVLLLGPALAPGLVLSYDMVWVPDLALRPDFLGVASGLPRAVPSDAVVAVLDEILPGQLLQKVVLLGTLVGGGLGIARLLADAPLTARLAAITVYQWSPFVAERLVIGHWPVLIGYAVLPWLLVLGRRWRVDARFPVALAVLVPVGSLSASAGLATGVALLAAVAGRDRRRLVLASALVLAANAPWLVSGFLHAAASRSDPAGAVVFALADEGSVPAPLAALTLGGVWNAEVVSPSRTDVLGWVALAWLTALVVLGLRHWWGFLGRRDGLTLAVCWSVGMLAALLTWASPDLVGWLAAHVPGGGLVRDGSRLLLLCAPAVATVSGVAVARVADLVEAGAAQRVVAGALVALPVLLMSDAALGVDGRLRAVDFPPDYAAARDAIAGAPPGDVLLLPLSSYRQPSWNNGAKVLDPAGRFQSRDFVASDELVVDGTLLAGEDPRVAAVAEALGTASAASRAEALAEEGIGVVVIDREAPGEVPEMDGEVLFDGPLLTVRALPGAEAPTVPAGWYVAMSLAWAVFLAGPGVAIARGAPRGAVRLRRT